MEGTARIPLDLASGQHTKAEVQRLMTRRGLRTKLGTQVSSQTIDNIFDGIFYAGVIRDPWTGDEYPGRHVPMVSREIFDAVKRVIHRRNRSIPHVSLRPEFPLRGFARCAACESTLTGSFSRGRSKYYPYYHCHHSSCTLPRNYPLAEVHDEFAGFLRTLSADGHAIDHLKEWAEGITRSRHDLAERLRAKREADAKRLRDQQQRLIQMRIDNLITEEEFRVQRQLIDSQLNDGVPPLALGIQELQALPSKVALICDPLQNIASYWESHQIEIRKRFQRILLPGGYVVTRIGTAPKARILSFLDGSLPANPIEVALEGESWNQLAREVAKLAAVVEGTPDPDEARLR
jgi:hypothetical protein